MNERSITALQIILEILNRCELTGLFFLTGHMSEKLASYRKILNLLGKHQIGYHSSSHSVRPTILEYTDTADYDKAFLESFRRESSHINPLTGEVEGRGGIHILRGLFPRMQIKAFRAPDYCWSPPHLEALKHLGIEYDFSTKLSLEPVSYKGITFYPYPIWHNWNGRSTDLGLFRSIISKGTTVLNFHDWNFVNEMAWNRDYIRGNPKELHIVSPRDCEERRKLFMTFESFLRKIQALRKRDLIEVTPQLQKSSTYLSVDRINLAEVCYDMASWYKKQYHYEPKYLGQHFTKFFPKKSR